MRWYLATIILPNGKPVYMGAMSEHTVNLYRSYGKTVAAVLIPGVHNKEASNA